MGGFFNRDFWSFDLLIIPWSLSVAKCSTNINLQLTFPSFSSSGSGHSWPCTSCGSSWCWRQFSAHSLSGWHAYFPGPDITLLEKQRKRPKACLNLTFVRDCTVKCTLLIVSINIPQQQSPWWHRSRIQVSHRKGQVLCPCNKKTYNWLIMRYASNLRLSRIMFLSMTPLS